MSDQDHGGGADELSVEELEGAAGGVENADPANTNCVAACGNTNCAGACGKTV